MKSKKGFGKSTAGYFLYFIVIALVLLWALLPVEYLRQWLQTYVHACLPQVVMEIEAAKRRLPFGASFETAKIRAVESGEVRAVIDTFDLQPDYSHLSRFQPAIRYRAEMYQGVVSGTGSYDRKSGNVHVTGQVEGVRLELTRLEYGLQRLIEGALSAQYEGNLEVRAHEVSSFQVSVKISDGAMELKQPFFGYSSIPFKSAACSLTGNTSVVRIEKGAVESPLFSATLQGEVELKRPIVGSVVNLHGTISPRPEFFAEIKDAGKLEQIRSALQGKEVIPFSVTGELGAPGVTLGALSQAFDQADKRGIQ